MAAHSPSLTRRSLLAGAGAAGLSVIAPPGLRAGPPAAVREFELVAGPARVALVGSEYPETEIWSYGGVLPGPEIRVKRGERIRVRATNRLGEETTVHWHGLRVPNEMDGVPHLTQKPIAPGETFTYEFACPDAGTFWYHPHQRSFEQVGRGLYGPLVVEEDEPIAVDRDVTWVLDDWLLEPDASISGGFGNMHDISHAGRIGNTVTVNGRLLDTYPVRAGERLRLRLVNAANARIFALRFEDHAPQVIALDGQPVAPHAPADSRVVLGPASRVDLVIDMTGEPGSRFRVIDDFYPRQGYRLLDLSYGPERLRAPSDEPIPALPANPLPEPDLPGAERHEIVLGGGMMGGMAGGMADGRMLDMREMMHRGLAWTINGTAATGHVLDPLLALKRGRSYVLAIRNDTVWHHPMHLHGHSFRVVARNGEPTARREWEDTVLVPPRERVDIAFVADNPGDWMFHCHVLEHQAGGMMSVVRVA